MIPMSLDGYVIENHLSILLKLYPDKGLNYDNLSKNPNITGDFLTANLDKPWNWDIYQEIQI